MRIRRRVNKHPHKRIGICYKMKQIYQNTKKKLTFDMIEIHLGHSYDRPPKCPARRSDRPYHNHRHFVHVDSYGGAHELDSARAHRGQKF